MSDYDGYGSRPLTAKFLLEQHGIDDRGGIALVNNHITTNRYTEPEIEDRVIHLLNDMIEAGY